jgi:ribosome-associated protein
MERKRETKQSAEALVDFAVKGAQEVKAVDVTVVDLRKTKNSIADFFVICTGTSDTHVEAIMASIEKFIYLGLEEDPWRTEGKANREWILLDYVNVVIHVFQKQKRKFYGLEDLWGDAEVTYVDDSASFKAK